MLRPDDELSASCKSRKAWEKNDARFNARLRGLIAALDMPSNCSSNSPLPAFTYIGRVNCVTGQGSAARHQIHILRQHGFLFRIIDAGSCVSPDPRAADPFIQAARQSDAGSESTCGTIVHLQPNTAEKFHRSTLYPRPHILVSVWETTKLPKEWVASINSYDQVWCATQWQFDIYRQSGIKASLLRLVPFSLDPSLYMAAPTNQRREKIFGSVFQWSERKDPECLIGAYLDAFAAADPVQLILKSYEGDSPTASISRRVEAIVRKLRPRGACPKISIVSSALDSAGMSKFYAMIDCYVSAHRGEGFGLPIAEALLYGRPVIATDWSAPAEYAAGLFRGVKHALQPPHNMDWQPFYSADQLWAQADRADMAAAMREAASGQVTYDPVLVRERFGVLAEQAGNAAKDAIRELLS